MEPEVHEGALSEETLDALVADLLAHTRVLEVKIKGGATRHAEVGPSVAEAVALLRVGEVRGVQIGYEWDGQLWLDTLLATPTGVRIVRTTR